MVFSVADVLPKMTTKTKRQILTKKKKNLTTPKNPERNFNFLPENEFIAFKCKSASGWPKKWQKVKFTDLETV